jgi:hypothetical protein
VVRAVQVVDLRSQDTSASRPVHSAFDDLVVRQKGGELLRDIGLPRRDVRAVVNDGIAKKDDTLLYFHWLPARTRSSGSCLLSRMWNFIRLAHLTAALSGR